MQDRIEQGFSFVTVGADGGLNANAANALQMGREAAGRDLFDIEKRVARQNLRPSSQFTIIYITLNIKTGL